MTTKAQTAKRYFQFLLIVLAAGAIYPLVYLKTNYQETILSVFGITLPQLNVIYSVLGIVFVVGYFPSGLLSDKFSCKWLLVASLFFTSLGGFWFAQIPTYTGVIIIYCIWGTFSVFTFWSAHMKLVKLLAKREEEGRFFGILDGGRGVVEALLASVAVVVFAAVLGPNMDNLASKRDALVAIIYLYSFVMLGISILGAIFLENDKKAAKAEAAANPGKKAGFTFRDLPLVFKNKYVYLLGGIIFMGYSVYWTVYYLGGFLETNVGVNAVVVSTIMVIVLWMRSVPKRHGAVLSRLCRQRQLCHRHRPSPLFGRAGIWPFAGRYPCAGRRHRAHSRPAGGKAEPASANRGNRGRGGELFHRRGRAGMRGRTADTALWPAAARPGWPLPGKRLQAALPAL